MKKIEVLFNEETGEVKIEALGYRGKSCKEATEFLEKALGTEVDVKQKAEWQLRNSEFVSATKKATGIDTEKLCG